MADVVHCNQCLRQPTADNQLAVKYFLTECEFLYCQVCVQTYAHSCSRCPQPVCRTIELSSKMREEMKLCFQDLMPYNERLIKVEHFQKKQRRRFLDAIDAQNRELTEQFNELKRKNQSLDNEVQNLKGKLARMEAQLVSGRKTAPAGHRNTLFTDGVTESPMDTDSGASIVEDLFKRQPLAANKASKIPVNVYPKPSLSPMQSLRKQRISVQNQFNSSAHLSHQLSTSAQPVYPSRHPSVASNRTNGGHNPPQPPMTVSQHRGYTTSLSALSSANNSARMSISSGSSTQRSSVVNLNKQYNSRRY